MIPIRLKYFMLLLLVAMAGCKEGTQKEDHGKLKVVTTTTMLTDLLQQLGGEAIQVEGLMGSGVDPHLYKASEGDVNKLYTADIVFYSGLHLEGKLVDIFEKMEKQHKKTVALAEILDKNELLSSEYFASSYDPHIWFNVQFWEKIAQYATEKLQEADPENAELFAENSKRYLLELDVLENEIKETINTLPKKKRILVTAHDAFNYFGE